MTGGQRVIAIGVMSGTSADGIEVAAAEIEDGRVTFIAHAHTDYESELRDRVLTAARGEPVTAAELATLHARLGDAYAAAVTGFLRTPSRRADVIAVHGQTVAHVPTEHATLQLGDASRVALATGVVTVSDFRSADMAAGGEGAPFVPFADHLMFASGAPRALLNLGGIANLTLLPTREADDVTAFDTGPANIVIDAIAQSTGALFDRAGAGAARGRVDEEALRNALAHPFFARPAPKSTGREDFGAAFAYALEGDVRRRGGSVDDALATATALTARSVAEALRRESRGAAWREVVVAGGGAANGTLMRMLADAVAPVIVRPIDDLGVPAAAREAIAFAVLGAYRLLREPNTLPRCTGASRAVCAGVIHAP